MLLQHAVKHHRAKDWIQDQSTLPYNKILTQCKTLETHCEQHQKTKEKACAELTSITAASATSSSMYQDAINA